jgi:DNA-binding NarL/FixJ family response regulator
VIRSPCVPCPHLSTVGPLAAATKDALHEIRATAAKLLAAPPLVDRACVTADGTAALTGRERDVLVRIAEGWTDTEIAEDLGVSETTVNTHTRRLYKRLGVRGRAQAVHVAWQRGYLGKDEVA